MESVQIHVAGLNPALDDIYGQYRTEVQGCRSLLDHASIEARISRLRKLLKKDATPERSERRFELLSLLLGRFMLFGWMDDVEESVGLVTDMVKDIESRTEGLEDALLPASPIDIPIDSATLAMDSAYARYLLLTAQCMIVSSSSSTTGSSSQSPSDIAPNAIDLTASLNALEECLALFTPGDPFRFAALIMIAVAHWLTGLHGPTKTDFWLSLWELKRGLWRYEEAAKEDKDGREMQETAAGMLDHAKEEIHIKADGGSGNAPKGEEGDDSDWEDESVSDDEADEDKGDNWTIRLGLDVIVDMLSLAAKANRPAPHPYRADTLALLVRALTVRAELDEGCSVYAHENAQDIDKAIEVGREALSLRPPPHPERRWILHDLGVALNDRFERAREMYDLELSIECFTELLGFEDGLAKEDAGVGDEEVEGSTGSDGDDKGDEGEDPVQDAKDDRSYILAFLTPLLWERFEMTGASDSLEEAIEYGTEAVLLREHPHPDRALSLNDLATCLLTRLEWASSTRRTSGSRLREIDQVVQMYEEVLGLLEDSADGDVPQTWSDEPNNSAASPTTGLANALLLKYQYTRDGRDLVTAIARAREGLAMRSESGRGRVHSLTTLGKALFSLSKEGNMGLIVEEGQPDDPLGEALELFHEALRLTPDTDRVGKALALENMAAIFEYRYDVYGDVEDVNKAVKAGIEALEMRGVGTRVEGEDAANKGDLASAIGLYEAAVGTWWEDEVDGGEVTGDWYAMCLSNLAGALLERARGDQNGETDAGAQDSEKSVKLYRRSLAHRPGTHAERASALVNLSSALLERCSISLRGGEGRSTTVVQTVQEVIHMLSENAVNLAPSPHPLRVRIYHQLAQAYELKYTISHEVGDLDQSFIFVREAATYNIELAFGGRSAHHRLISCQLWARKARFYERMKTEGMSAYRTAMKLLPPLASVEMCLSARRRVLSHVEGLPAAAARMAIEVGEVDEAVAFLTTMSSTFWEQEFQIRDGSGIVGGEEDLKRLKAIDGELAGRFESVSKELKVQNWKVIQSAELSTSVYVNPEAEETSMLGASRWCHIIANERELLLQKIRSLEGFGDFLLPPSIDKLKRAARKGPLVFLTGHEEYGCDALILTTSGVKHIPLVDLTFKACLNLIRAIYLLTTKQTMVFVDRDGREGLGQASRSCAKEVEGKVGVDDHPERTPGSWDDYLRGMRNAPLKGRPREFEEVLKALWVTTVKPVIQKLGLNKVEDSPSKQRIWWYPTGPFTLLPIHAAGVYSQSSSENEECVMDYAISSYCSTMHGLLHDCDDSIPSVSSHLPDSNSKVLAVIQRDIPDRPDLTLRHTVAELETIKKHVKNLEVHLGCDAPLSITTPEQVLKSMPAASIVHFGCHGKQDLRNPLNSYLLLSGGKLTMGDLIRGSASNVKGLNGRSAYNRSGRLAYLSACETAKVDLKRLDQALHLTGSLAFAGFSSTIGTLWSIADEDGPIVADVVYGHLFKKREHLSNLGPESAGDGLDVTQSAYALHLAVSELRRLGRAFEKWVPFVHFGI
ncbi:CHAT domain-containing protein [Ephemerocybe angulata]|uniref:CHAT domain-containing protein n=1 Tax=Ephemerocybe angulata TaxID=980116 RepID=A0A8H6HWK1_9AGAR|nr:CHAT domain-containing protein [Tulosesus angulatus]